jgi:transcriptional regulator with XRE-family HTH domain
LKARTDAGLSQSDVARMMGVPIGTWRGWEYGRFRMPPPIFELFIIKTGQFTVQRVVAGNENYPTKLTLRLRGGKDVEVTLTAEVAAQLVKALQR